MEWSISVDWQNRRLPCSRRQTAPPHVLSIIWSSMILSSAWKPFVSLSNTGWLRTTKATTLARPPYSPPTCLFTLRYFQQSRQDPSTPVHQAVCLPRRPLRSTPRLLLDHPFERLIFAAESYIRRAKEGFPPPTSTVLRRKPMRKRPIPHRDGRRQHRHRLCCRSSSLLCEIMVSRVRPIVPSTLVSRDRKGFPHHVPYAEMGSRHAVCLCDSALADGRGYCVQ